MKENILSIIIFLCIISLLVGGVFYLKYRTEKYGRFSMEKQREMNKNVALGIGFGFLVLCAIFVIWLFFNWVKEITNAFSKDTPTCAKQVHEIK